MRRKKEGLTMAVMQSDQMILIYICIWNICLAIILLSSVNNTFWKVQLYARVERRDTFPEKYPT